MGGIAVHIAARIAARAAGRSAVLEHRQDLVSGSGLGFAPAAEHTLKGVPDAWTLFALET